MVLTINTFAPARNPQMPLDSQVQPRVLSPQFGAGYPTFAPDGINTVLKQVSLTFIVLTQSQFNYIDSFMTANRGLFFYYQLPDESYPRLWLMTSRTGRQRATTWEYDLTIAEQPSL